jgi:hypothetical protein
MVNGIESFVRKFRDYADCYTVIGGTACDILMTEADTEFRATRDIDMILIMEARYPVQHPISNTILYADNLSAIHE